MGLRDVFGSDCGLGNENRQRLPQFLWSVDDVDDSLSLPSPK